jgi:cyclic beta-1,2-glucan synthetase
MTITRKRLLQCVTVAHTLSVFGKELKIRLAWQEIIFAPLSSVFLFLLAVIWNPSCLWLAGPFLITWTLSPFFAVRISRPISYQVEKISPQHERHLRQLARNTWLYFETFVGPDDHWLSPDHFQEDQPGLIAHRTSPTNIGLFLLSTLSAYDLGYIRLQELVLRVRNTLDGMDRLEKHRGHFLNWYDTRTLDPLPPRYISTVDSGNLVTCLLTLHRGCQDVAGNPIIQWDGSVDTLDVLDVTLHQFHLDSAAIELHDVISRLRKQAEGLRDAHQCNPQFLMSLFRESRVEMEELLARVIEASAEQLDSDAIHRLSAWIERTRHHLAQAQRDMENLCPWSLAIGKTPALFTQPDIQPELATAWNALLSVFSFKPSLANVPVICARALDALQHVRALVGDTEQEASAWCKSFTSQIETTQTSANDILSELQDIGARSESYIQAMNFRFLYDPQRKVFHIGYNVDTGRLDTSYYDLPASEARLTSLLAIAEGDVPQNHWLYLARPITQLEGTRALISWSGTMFEYLMPTLLTRRYPNSLLEQSCCTAVEHQIAYGQSKHTPWGISESGFYFFDANQAYQYRAFGVPGLGYKHGLAEDIVVSPYASVLALFFAPQAVLQNLDRFQKLNMAGLYDLYEAVDFTADRLGTGQDCAIVHSYMAHHQGMILLSLCNFLRNGIMIRRFHADPRIDTVRFLLQEQLPVRAPIEYPRPHEIGNSHPVYTKISLSAWKTKFDAPNPQVHFLSNGNYGLLITAAGSGYSSWRGVDLTRWRADTTLDQYGTWIYIQARESNQFWSASFQPTAAQPASQETCFYPHTVEFMRWDGDISTRMNIAIAPDADVEIRRITLTNHGESAQALVLTSYAEVILSP